MLKFTATINGHAQDDLVIALDVIRRQVSQGFTCGFSENDTGLYRFNIDGEPEQYLFRVIFDWQDQKDLVYETLAENESDAVEKVMLCNRGAEIIKVEKLT
jgi:hypothetical protein